MLEHEVHGEGRTIVFVHGLTLDRALLRDTLEPVFADRPGWRRVYLDLPGHGKSPARSDAASADGLVATLAEFLGDCAAGPPPLVVGHAYGAYLAQGLLAAGTALGGLFLLCPVVEPDFAARRLPPQRHTVVDAPDALAFAGAEEQGLFEGEVAVQSRAVLEGFRRLVAPAHQTADRTFIAAVRGRYASSLPLRSAAAQFSGGKVAIVCGRDDYWAGFLEAAGLAAAFSGASLAVVPGTGTLLPLEAPERLRRDFVDWLT